MYKMETLFAVVAIAGVIAASVFAYNYYSKYNNIPQAPLPDFNNMRTFSNQSAQTYNSLDNQNNLNNLTYSDLLLASPISKETPFLTGNYSTSVLVRTGEIDKDFKLHLKFLGVNENVIDKIINTSGLGVNISKMDSDKLILNIGFEKYQRTEFDEEIGRFIFFTLPYKKTEKIKKLGSGTIPTGVYAYRLKSLKEWDENNKIYRNNIYFEINQSLNEGKFFEFPHNMKLEIRDWGAIVPSDIKEIMFSGADETVVFATDKISKERVNEIFNEIVNGYSGSSGGSLSFSGTGGGSGGGTGGGGTGGGSISGTGGGGTGGGGTGGGGTGGGGTGGGGTGGGGTGGGGTGGGGGSGNIGSGNSGSGNIGNGNSGSGNIGSGNSGSGNIGSGNIGSGNIGNGNR